MPAMPLDAVYQPRGFAMNSSLLRTLRRMTLFGQPDSNYSNLRELRLRPQLGLCTISGCRSGFVSGGGSAGGWFLCPEHYLRASRRSRRTHMRALFWQAMIEKCFSEPTLYDRIVSSGQYLKLCTLAEDVARQVDESWRQVILEADPTAGKSPATRDRRARQRRPGISERRCRR
jgi:hypothetical protein